MTRRELALLLLREAGPRGVTTGEFLDGGVGSRYSARVRELRQQGHPITSERLREGSWRYTLSEAPAHLPDCEPMMHDDYEGMFNCAPGCPVNEVEAGVSAGPSVESLTASVESGGALAPVEDAAQLFPDDDAWLALRAKDVA